MILTAPPGDGELIYVCGSSRSGKSAYVQAATARARLLAWDVEAQYRATRVTTRAGLAREARAGSRRIAFTPRGLGAFPFWCAVAETWIKAERLRAGPGSALVVEELADVTHPGRAPDAWGRIVRRGLKWGPTIYAITQRPAESDKTALGNATRVVVFRLASRADRRYLAARLPVEPGDLPDEPLTYLALDTATGARERGRVAFRRGRARLVSVT